MNRKVLNLVVLMLWSAMSAQAVDTLYIRQTDTIVIREVRYRKVPVQAETPEASSVAAPQGGTSALEESQKNCEDNVWFVYFPSGRYGLDEEAQKEVHQMAQRLNDNPEMGVRITGYCDYIGPADLNDRLSVARATVVGNRLKNAYGIDEKRIEVEGKGRLTNVKADYSPNRRVEMRMVNMGNATQATHAPTANGGTPSNLEGESQKPEIELLATETVTETTTLARLARKHYGNPFCWVYIYAMNKSLIPNPNQLRLGQQLRIPKLGEVDKQITKQESEEYYKMLKRGA